jgi:hypothetical protein
MSEVEKYEGSGTVAVPSDDPWATGLEDFDVTTDAVMPRLRIIGKDATFEDNLTGERHSKIKVVLLGLVKQRILWDEEVKEGDGPLCRSNNFSEGEPYLKDFPWKASKFERDDYDKGRDGGEVMLPCANCALKEWGTNPRGGTPWCSEQHTFPLLMLDEHGNTSPAVLTLQRSAIKASKSYVTGFARTRTPLYTAVTEISLNAMRRGSVDYAVPSFVKAGETDREDWSGFADQYRSIREFLTSKRSKADEQDEASEPAAAPARSDSREESRRRDEPSPAPRYDDEEPPF